MIKGPAIHLCFFCLMGHCFTTFRSEPLADLVPFNLVSHVIMLWPACGSDLANRSGAPKCYHSTIIPDQIHVSGRILLSGISDCASLNIDTISAIPSMYKPRYSGTI